MKIQKNKRVLDAVQMSLPELISMVEMMKQRGIFGITMNANYSNADDCIGSVQWKEKHEKKGHLCDWCKPVKDGSYLRD